MEGSLLLSATRISRVNGARGRWAINHPAPTVPSRAAPRDEAVSALLLLSPVPKLTFPFSFWPRKFRDRKRADYWHIRLRLPIQGYQFCPYNFRHSSSNVALTFQARTGR